MAKRKADAGWQPKVGEKVFLRASRGIFSGATWEEVEVTKVTPTSVYIGEQRYNERQPGEWTTFMESLLPINDETRARVAEAQALDAAKARERKLQVLRQSISTYTTYCENLELLERIDTLLSRASLSGASSKEAP